jgi:hypothetical protein
MIFVFGSNESGIHGAGAAKVARLQHGAITGVGFGKQGNSFAIPTKDWKIETLPFDVIQHYVNRFIVFARMSPKAEFQITQIGCGLAGLDRETMAFLFRHAPDNCYFDTAWKPHFEALKKDKKYWGTFP